MQDSLFRGILDALDIRFAIVDCPQTAQDIILRHDCDPVSAHVLSRAVGAAALVSTHLTEDEKYTLRWNYQGKLSCLIADCDAQAHVRALIIPTDLASQVNNEAEIWGQDGTMTVIKSTATQILNSGSTSAGLLDVVEDLAFHFSTSDQVETAMAVLTGFRPDPQNPVSSCRGIMLQALPDCDLERFDRVRNRLASPECRHLLASPVVPDALFEQFAMLLCQNETEDHAFTLEPSPAPSFRCSCTKQSMIAALATLSNEEKEDILNKDGAITMTCRFCNTTHKITREDLAR